MRSKLLDQFKYINDISSATDRTGFDSALQTVKQALM